jgi:hypothetical protein
LCGGLFYWFLLDRFEADERVPCDLADALKKFTKLLPCKADRRPRRSFLASNSIAPSTLLSGAFSRSTPRPYLSRIHRTRGLTAEIAPHRDALRIDRPRELTSVSSTAVIRQRADQLIGGSVKYPQCRCRTGARRFNSKSSVTRIVFGSRNRNGVGAAAYGIDGQSS